MKFQTAYINPKQKHKHCGVVCEEDMTLQAHKDECDINKIINTYDKTGVLVGANNMPREYGEQPSVTLHEAMNIVLEAQRDFNNLPSQLRSKFDNDPAKFMDFVHNPDNIEEMQELGLSKRPDSPIEVKVTNPVTEPQTTTETSEGKV